MSVSTAILYKVVSNRYQKLLEMLRAVASQSTLGMAGGVGTKDAYRNASTKIISQKP